MIYVDVIGREIRTGFLFNQIEYDVARGQGSIPRHRYDITERAPVHADVLHRRIELESVFIYSHVENVHNAILQSNRWIIVTNSINQWHSFDGSTWLIEVSQLIKLVIVSCRQFWSKVATKASRVRQITVTFPSDGAVTFFRCAWLQMPFSLLFNKLQSIWLNCHENNLTGGFFTPFFFFTDSFDMKCYCDRYWTLWWILSGIFG